MCRNDGHFDINIICLFLLKLFHFLLKLFIHKYLVLEFIINTKSFLIFITFNLQHRLNDRQRQTKKSTRTKNILFQNIIFTHINYFLIIAISQALVNWIIWLEWDTLMKINTIYITLPKNLKHTGFVILYVRKRWKRFCALTGPWSLRRIDIRNFSHAIL